MKETGSFRILISVAPVMTLAEGWELQDSLVLTEREVCRGELHMKRQQKSQV
jgi:hypothetical protein